MSLLCLLWEPVDLEGWFPFWLHPLSPSLAVSLLMPPSQWPCPAFWDALLEAERVGGTLQPLARWNEKIPFPWKIYAAANRVKSLCPYSCLPKDQLLGFEYTHQQSRQVFTWNEWLYDLVLVTCLSLPACFPGCHFHSPCGAWIELVNPLGGKLSRLPPCIEQRLIYTGLERIQPQLEGGFRNARQTSEHLWNRRGVSRSWAFPCQKSKYLQWNSWRRGCEYNFWSCLWLS